MQKSTRKPQSKIAVPYELSTFALREKKTKELKLLLYLKTNFDNGVAHIGEIGAIPEAGMCRKTVSKYLKNLYSMKWASLNKKTGYIHIRSINYICQQLGLKTRTRYIFYGDYKHITQFFFASSVSAQIRRQEHSIRLSKHQHRESAKSLGVVYHSDRGVTLPYTGLSVGRIADITGLSRPVVGRMKKDAMKLGYLEFKHKYHKTFVMDGFASRKKLFYGNSDVSKRMRFVEHNGKVYVLEQLWDSCSSLLDRVRRGKKLANGITKH